jgi:lysophospholipase L1-like esterase/N-acetylneuraminic acid mutarotase
LKQGYLRLRLSRRVAAVALSLIATAAAGLATPAAAGAAFSLIGYLPPENRYWASSVWDGQHAYVFGGETQRSDGSTYVSRQIIRVDPATGSRSVVAYLPTARSRTSAIWDGQSAYIFGGWKIIGDYSSNSLLKEVVRYTPSTNSVTVMTTSLPLAGAIHHSTVWDPVSKSAHIFGGKGLNGYGSDKTVRYYPDKNSSYVRTNTLPTVRDLTSATFDGKYGYVYGGRTPNYISDEILRYDVGTGAFTLVGRLPSARYATSAAGDGRNAYIFGGIKGLSYTDEILLHTPGNGKITTIATKLPGVYAAMAPVNVGNEYLLLGGSPPTNKIHRFAPPRPPLRYVALGDSYSAGEGLAENNGPYLEGGDPDCHRHSRGYPPLFRFGSSTPALNFFACSGAKTSNIWFEPQDQEPIQLSHPEVNDQTELVTMTIGGNDVDFSGILTHCALRVGCDTDSYRNEVTDRILAAGPKLARTYQAIKDEVGPNTTIIVSGYPLFFPDDSIEALCPALSPWDPGEQGFLNAATALMVDVIRQEAAKAGVHFDDIIPDFRDHAICDSEGDDWMNAVEVDGGWGGDASFHPNALGYNLGYRGSLERFINEKLAAGGPRTPAGLPAAGSPAS